MKTFQISNTIATGFAIFSMFFGAGNIVFPLALGKLAQNQYFFAYLGLLVTAVFVPFLGLLAMTLFDGNHKEFFAEIGQVPGFILELSILCLIGPFGALPRCIVLSHASLDHYVGNIPLLLFSFISCIVIFAFTYKRSTLIDLLGYVLTPFLLLSLFAILIKGFFTPSFFITSSHSSSAVFVKGLLEGYQTMDLLGAFFFSSVVLICLRREINIDDAINKPKLIKMTILAGLIGMFLLGLTYFGFCQIAGKFSDELLSVPKENLLSKIAFITLGTWGGIITAIAVSLACLTTAIALAAVFADFLQKQIFLDKINYHVTLLITLIISFGFSTLQFDGIAKFLSPILLASYPALIVLSFFSLLYKLTGIRWIATPFYITLTFFLLLYFVE